VLPRIVADSEVGKQVPIVLWRDGKEVTVTATLAEKPSEAQLAAADAGKGDVAKPVEIAGLGMKIAPVSQDLKDKYQLSGEQKGVVITDVAPGGAAADKGLKPGDVIMEVQQNEVGSPADVQKRVDAARKADRKFVLMLIQRQDGVQYVPLSLARSGKDKQPG
jgi:serine protease Do